MTDSPRNGRFHYTADISLGNILSIGMTVLTMVGAVAAGWGIVVAQNKDIAELSRRVTNIEQTQVAQTTLINAALATTNAELSSIKTSTAVMVEQIRALKEQQVRFENYLENRLGIKPPR